MDQGARQGDAHRAPAPSAGADPAGDAADRPASPTDIRDRALRLLGTREHSRRELTRKLLRRGDPEDAVNAVLDALSAEGLLDEARLLEVYVAERLDKGFGPLRIRQELRDKGLADAEITPHLALDETDLLALMTSAASKRFGHEPPTTRAELAKRARFLEYRGFPAHLIVQLLDLD